MAKKEKKKLSLGKKLAIIIPVSVLVTAITAAVGYVGYIVFSYYRIGDKPLTVQSRAESAAVSTETTYSAMSYNIGFGAYSQDYTFFMDTGYDDKGKETCGHYGTAKSKGDVLTNTVGAVNAALAENPDFVMFQEVDVDSTRSYHVNQYKAITDAFPSYDAVYCENFHSAFLPYPLYDMHGAVKAGLTTISSHKIEEAERKEYTVSDSLSKLFDLDRCFSVSKIKVQGSEKYLHIVNSHMSAYDEAGIIRAKQMRELNAYLQSVKDAGDYLVLGGDFNHDLITYNPEYSYNLSDNRAFSMTKKAPDWVSYFFDEEGVSPLVDGFAVVASDNVPTCRNNDIEWDVSKTFQCVVDGFIVSDNVEVVSHRNVATNGGKKDTDWFAWSDHQPSYLEFKLKA